MKNKNIDPAPGEACAHTVVRQDCAPAGTGPTNCVCCHGPLNSDRQCSICDRDEISGLSNYAPYTPVTVRASTSPSQPVAWRWRPLGATEWIYNPTPEWLAEHRHKIECEPLFVSPRALNVEEVARTLCQSGKFETGEGTCALICMDQLGDPRKNGCHHAATVHKALAAAIAKGNK